MAKCKNEKCYAGRVEILRPATKNEPAGWDSIECPDCKGEWCEPLTIPEQLEKIAAVGKDEDSEFPF